MTKQTTHHLHRPSGLLTVIALVLLFAAAAVAQEKSIGAKYGSREPQKCADTKAPARGKISPALAAKYFICASEQEDYRYLYLVENVKVEVGGGIPYAAIVGHRSFPEVDVKHPVYPIRGSHTQYQCNPESDTYQPGKNCTRYEHRNAKGYCYKTTFGDWRCFQSELSVPNDNIFERVPPPGGKMAANDKPAPTANTKQTAETNDKPNAVDKDANGIVKPDFSEMEKDFEIVRYEYDTSTRPPAIWVFAKVKTPSLTNALRYESRFYDADGINIMLPAERVWAVTGDTSKVGEVVKLRIWTPSEMQMRDKVKKIVVVAKLD